jgi:hypothetical protein
VGDDAVDELMSLLNRLRVHDQEDRRSSQHHMNSIVNHIESVTKALVRPKASASPQDLRDQIYVSEDVVPVLQTHLENILHNQMLRNMV